MSECGDLMNAIAGADVEPSVLTISVVRGGHMSGFLASVAFRTYNKDAVRDITTHGLSPEEALQRAYDNLMALYGPCPHCGRHGPKPGETE